MDPILLEFEEYTSNAEKVKSIVINTLMSEGFLDIKKAKEFEANYAVVIIKTIWWKKIFTNNSDKWSYSIVKVVKDEKDE